MISQSHRACGALAKTGIEHGAAGKVTSKVHKQSVLAPPQDTHLEQYYRKTRQKQIIQARSTLGLKYLFPLDYGLWS